MPKKNTNLKISVIEDNDWYNKLLVHTLSLNPEFEIKSYLTAADFFYDREYIPQIITLDYRLPDATGDVLIPKIKEEYPNAEIIIISEQEDIETAIDLLKIGAYDYLVKSKDIRDRLLNSIHHIVQNIRLQNEVVLLKKEVISKYNFENTVLGNSAAIKQIFELMSKALNTNITVSITGETGTGKEVAAKAIHFNSNRKNKPFIAINMAAIPSELVESELFGHEKGSFTGALTRRIGKFEEAADGTLFLDEMGEMDMNSQAKLLRALQEREITRVGSNQIVKINCRIIIATNKDLLEEVKKGNFREDLYYRLFGLPIHLPPLRERGSDILLLAKHFVEQFAKENQLPSKSFSEEAINKLMQYNWPGNIRELKSIVELAFVLANDQRIESGNITTNSLNTPNNDYLFENLTLREYNRKIVNLYMQKYNRNTKIVADKLGIGQTTVYRLLKEDFEDGEQDI